MSIDGRKSGNAVCQHAVAVPASFNCEGDMDSMLYGTLEQPVFNGQRAKAYPFTLDDFQEIAIACIERNESVMVAAHTSAGKTAVAEYAIAKSLGEQQRVIYTSPLKALSNQKYRELSSEFGDVGLLTGDVSLNPNAKCVVMTTEILRSTMYHGSDLLREVAWVIFDEIHYMQDRERGVVWEEVIIYMPRTCRMIFLSATLPNAFEFAEWVAHIHGLPCHMVSTSRRPTPLVHFGLPVGGDGLFLLVDERGNFNPTNFQKLELSLKNDSSENLKNGSVPTDQETATKDQSNGGISKKRRIQASVEDDLMRLIHVIHNRQLFPVVIFSFSRRECEAFAHHIVKKPKRGGDPPRWSKMLDFNSPEEKEKVNGIFELAMQCLSPQDRDLPIVHKMSHMFQYGIAVHHSGLLPILKELVEILFQEQLIKCLFATETFAMGLNMPARSVVFTSLKKWDGEDTRYISSGEYTQMSGRAGRRGKDKRGNAIVFVDDSLKEDTFKEIVKGTASPLVSSFKLSYYTLVNVLRHLEGTGKSIEYVISRSFSQFQYEKQMPGLKDKYDDIMRQADGIDVDGIEDYIALKSKLEELQAKISNSVLKPDLCIQFLRPGRIVRVSFDSRRSFYGIVVSTFRMDDKPSSREGESYMIDLLLCCEPSSTGFVPSSLDSENGEMVVVPVMFSVIKEIYALRISLPNDLKPSSSRYSALQTLRELKKSYAGGNLPELDPVRDFGISDKEIVEAVSLAKKVASEIAQLDSQGTAKESLLREKARLLAEADAVSKEISGGQLHDFQDEAKSRLVVLTRLGHITKDSVLTLKGRAMSEIDNADELVVSELIFNGTFHGMDKYRLAALLSCLVPVEQSNLTVSLEKEMSEAFDNVLKTVHFLLTVFKECKVHVDEDTYVAGFKPTLMKSVYAWTKGASFQEICEGTDLFEGSIIRAFRRLDEVINSLERASKAIGDIGLAALLNESGQCLRRGLPFAASLYI